MSTKEFAVSKFCEVCSYGDSYRGMGELIQCKQCKIFVHIECYFVDTLEGAEYVDKEKQFTCIACQSIGRTVQSVETHWSTMYQMVEQKERPLTCELCSVSDKVTAMHPLYDYHGTSGRHLCLKNDNGTYRLAWGHTICCLYLSTNGFLYGFKINGGYQEDDDGDGDELDPREINPTTVLTPEFEAAAKLSGACAMTYFRYYAPFSLQTDENKLDMYREAMHDHKRGLVCVYCRKDDSDPRGFRIPLQCIAGVEDEFDWINSGRIQKKGELHSGLKESCTVALHVGCGRWGQPNPSNLQRVHWWYKDPDGEACLYCTKHAEDVGIKLPALPTKPSESKIQKKPNAQKAKSTFDKEHNKEGMKDKTLSFSRRSSASIPSLSPAKPIKRKSSSQVVDHGSNLPSTSIPRKKKEKPESISVAKPVDVSGQPSQVTRRGHQWGRKPRDRYAELDSSIAVAVNAGDRPTLKNSRKELAAQKSKVTLDMVQLVLNDLLEKIRNMSDRGERNATIKGRKLFWKRKFSELTKEDFKEIWDEAKRKYYMVRSSKSNNNASSESTVVDSTVVDRVGDDDDDTPVASSLDANEESAIQTTLRQEPPIPYHDRWSHLFVGPTFRMGNEFTLDDLDEYV